MAYSKNRRLAEIVSDTSGNLSVEGIVVPTQSSSDNDTSAASTAFVHAHIDAVLDSAPGTLNTLNEIAAALNDDANFNTTVTNAIAAKLPLAGGTLTGDLTLYSSAPVLAIKDGGTHGTNSTPYLEFRDGSSVQSTIGITNTAGDLSVWNTKNTNLRFATNNTERMRIRETGAIEITGSSTTTSAQAFITNDNSVLTIGSSVSGSVVKDIAFNSPSTMMYIDGSAGNVGIGTSGPLGKLHVRDGSAQAGISHTYIYDGSAISIEATEPAIQLMAEDSGTHGGSLLWRYGNNAFAAIANPTTDTIDFTYGVTNNNDFQVHSGTNMSSYLKIMSIGANGKVGIGTDSPASPLHVKTTDQSIQVRNTGNANVGLEIYRDSDGAKGASIGWGNGNANLEIKNYRNDGQSGGPYANIDFFTGGTDADSPDFNPTRRMRIQQTGQVGIGTDDPGTLLELRTDTSSGSYGSYPALSIRNDNGAGYGAIHFQEGSTQRARVEVGNNSGTPYMGLYTTGGALGITIKGGNVGIGVATSETLLHVKGSNNSAGDLYTQVGPGNVPSITVQNAGTTDNNNAAIYFRDDQDMRGSINMRFVNHSTHASELRFATTQANNTREKFVMTAAGQLGINKMSGFDTGGFGTPMLVIKQAVNSSWGGINVEANGNDSIFSISCLDSGSTLNTSYRTGAGHKPLTMQCAGQDGVQIGTGGNVRIGSGNVASNGATHQLHVDSGTIGYGLKVHSNTGYGLQGSNNGSYFHHSTDRAMNYWDSPGYFSGGAHTYSDSRLKENVVTITGALDSVAKMNGVTFTWINGDKRRGPDGKQFGVLAQNMLEVDSALPTLNVDPLETQDNIDDDSKDTDYYSMDYARLTPYFIEAIKELKTKLEAAEARIATLEG